VGELIDRYRAGTLSGPSLLINILRKYLGHTALLPDWEKADWKRQAEALTGKADWLELAAAARWCLVEDSFWTARVYGIASFAKNVDTILEQYRGWERAQAVLKRQANAKPIKPKGFMHEGSWGNTNLRDIEPFRPPGPGEVPCPHCGGGVPDLRYACPYCRKPLYEPADPKPTPRQYKK
jgi:hypothetical protein